MKRPGPSRIHSGSGSTAADRVAACRVQMRRRSELAMPCPRAVGCFAVPAQPQSTYLGMFFVQSHHHRHRDQVMAGHSGCHLTFEPLRAVSVKLRFGASTGSQDCGWLRSLADSLISDMQQAILAQPYHMRMRSVLDGCVQPAAVRAAADSSTPACRHRCSRVSRAVRALSCPSDLPRCLLRCRATWMLAQSAC